MWWTKKYKLPSNHELFTSRTLFDLLVEYQLDVIEENPLEAHRNSDGEIQFKDTGDDMIDRWEQQIADGMTPDLEAAFDYGELEKINRKITKAKKAMGQSGVTFGDTEEKIHRQVSKEDRARAARDLPIGGDKDPFFTFGE